jgi:gluconolactonase
MKTLLPLLSLRELLLRILFGCLAIAAGLEPVSALAGVLPDSAPLAAVDLTTSGGLASVAGTWRYSDARIVETRFRAPGKDGQPTGAMVATYDVAPRAGVAAFDDSAWTVLTPRSLSERRGSGRLSFNWYRLSLTIPERLDGVPTAGKTAVFETSVDDYAEVWVDSELTREPAQSGGSVVAGWNGTNRLVVARHVKPGQQIVIAVFGANGPLSDPPTNFIYMRSAKLLLHDAPAGPVAITPAEVNVEVIRKDRAIDEIVGPNLKLHKLADGFEFTEGPVWSVVESSLLFSDPNENVIYRYSEAGDLSVFRRNAGYDGADIAEYRQPGSNGLAFDSEGRLLVDEHGRRRITRIERDGSVTVLAAEYTGRRLNSPNDLVVHSGGAVYFTDPPFGLPQVFADRRKELDFSGVYRTAGGQVELLAKDLSGPNGIALSPDEKYLYVGNWDEKRKVVMRYPVLADGRLGAPKVFFDMTSAPGEDAIDGVKVDVNGNVYVSGPGGLWILSADGRHLGTIVPPKHPHNMAWGGADGKTLYLCARSALYRMELGIEGVRRETRAGDRAEITNGGPGA